MTELDRGLLAAAVNGCRAYTGDCVEPCTLRAPEGHTTGIEHYSKAQRDTMFILPWSNRKVGHRQKGRAKYTKVLGIMSSEDKYKTFLSDKERAALSKKLKKDILREAKKQFVENGYRSTTNSTITAALGYGAKDQKVRYYFQNKANLYREVFGEDYEN